MFALAGGVADLEGHDRGCDLVGDGARHLASGDAGAGGFEPLLGDFGRSVGFLLLLGGLGVVVTMLQFPNGIAGFAAMRALSTRNDAPARASRPWDVDRDGFVVGEGAGILVLEERGHEEGHAGERRGRV